MVIKPETNLRLWMTFHRGVGPNDGAALAFAHSHQEARKVSHVYLGDWGMSDIGESYIDCAAKLIRDPDDALWLEANWEKLSRNEAHAFDDVTCCSSCMYWGHVRADGICSSCGSDSVTISIRRARNQNLMKERQHGRTVDELDRDVAVINHETKNP